jgi:hypothetical protein
MATFLGGINGTSSSNKLTAITKKNQTNVNKAIYWGMKYNEINDMRDRADDSGDMKAYRKFDRMAANAFDKHLEFMDSLPKGEQARVERFVFPR